MVQSRFNNHFIVLQLHMQSQLILLLLVVHQFQVIPSSPQQQHSQIQWRQAPSRSIAAAAVAGTPNSASGEPVIRLENTFGYQTRINLQNDDQFPSRSCKSEYSSTCHVKIIPPNGHGLVAVIQYINIRRKSMAEVSADRAHWVRTTDVDDAQGYRCRDYLMFFEAVVQNGRQAGSTNSRKVCGQMNTNSVAVGSEDAPELIGPYYFITKPGNELVIAFHHDKEDAWKYEWNPMTQSYSLSSQHLLARVEGEILVSSYAEGYERDVLREPPPSPSPPTNPRWHPFMNPSVTQHKPWTPPRVEYQSLYNSGALVGKLGGSWAFLLYVLSSLFCCFVSLSWT